jgi:hypothetical protein
MPTRLHIHSVRLHLNLRTAPTGSRRTPALGQNRPFPIELTQSIPASPSAP